MGTWILMGLVGVLGVIVGSLVRRSNAAEIKPFGLEAFEAHGLGRASSDVLKAVVATISFLGHPFTVVEEAAEARVSAAANSTRTFAQIEDNLDEIRDLEARNISLEARARLADARASDLAALVAQVSSVVGS